MTDTFKRPTIQFYPVKHMTREGEREPPTKWSWRLLATNGEQIAQASEGGGFASLRGAWDNLRVVTSVFGAQLPHKCPVSADYPDALMGRTVDLLKREFPLSVFKDQDAVEISNKTEFVIKVMPPV